MIKKTYNEKMKWTKRVKLFHRVNNLKLNDAKVRSLHIGCNVVKKTTYEN